MSPNTREKIWFGRNLQIRLILATLSLIMWSGQTATAQTLENVETLQQNAGDSKKRSAAKISEIHRELEQKSRERDLLSQKIADFRITNGVDVLRNHREQVQQSLQKTSADILQLESEMTQLEEWEKTLRDVQKDPEKFGALVVNAPCAQEIVDSYRRFHKVASEHAGLLQFYTPTHDDVKVKARELEFAKQSFLRETAHALETSVMNINATKRRLAVLEKKRETLRSDLASDEQKIVRVEMQLSKLDSELKITEEIYKSLYHAEIDLRRQLMLDEARE